MLGDERNLGCVFTLHLGVSHVLIDREDKKGRRGNIWCWLQTISILNVRLPRLVRVIVMRLVLGRDATKRFLKNHSPLPSLNSYRAKSHAQMAAAGVGTGVGKALLIWEFTSY